MAHRASEAHVSAHLTPLQHNSRPHALLPGQEQDVNDHFHIDRALW